MDTGLNPHALEVQFPAFAGMGTNAIDGNFLCLRRQTIALQKT